MCSSQETDADHIFYNRKALPKEGEVDKYLYDYAAKGSKKYAQAYSAHLDPEHSLY